MQISIWSKTLSPRRVLAQLGLLCAFSAQANARSEQIPQNEPFAQNQNVVLLAGQQSPQAHPPIVPQPSTFLTPIAQVVTTAMILANPPAAPQRAVRQGSRRLLFAQATRRLEFPDNDPAE